MNRMLLAGLFGVSFLIAAEGDAPAATPAETAAPAPVASATAQASYAIGIQIGKNLQQEQLDLAEFRAGLEDALAGRDSRIPPDQFPAVMAAWQAERSAGDAQASAGRKAENATFLATNKDKPGITTTASGLQYEVLKSGAGKTPTAENRVKVQYIGTFLDGTKFDASADHGGDAEFPVNGVIRGWTEALQLMKEGDRWKLYVPSDLAYGEQGPPGIGADRLLVFEVELVAVMD
jgi:FKBP-type peptidyl-prolyl cis-trans isomerase